MNTQPSVPKRFADPTVSLYDLSTDPIHAVCPACQARAEVVPWLDGEPPSRWVDMWPRRMVCRTCHYVRNWPDEDKNASSGWGGPVDPFFRQPLWLQADCCGHTLWAFNVRHLDILENYVSAQLRERGEYVGLTMLARLPAWLKSSKNRTEILRTINRLRETLPE
ncbi:hypothetical protein [Actinomadura meridiana]|uniref:hypothetical protein n=1 Tax=Actinomadura meridiana TaxID=559626 RepID=UPI0031EB9017